MYCDLGVNTNSSGSAAINLAVAYLPSTLSDTETTECPATVACILITPLEHSTGVLLCLHDSVPDPLCTWNSAYPPMSTNSSAGYMENISYTFTMDSPFTLCSNLLVF